MQTVAMRGVVWMAKMAPPSDYEDDVERIDRDYIDSGSTTQSEIEADLEAADFADSAQSDIADWLVSEEDVWPEVGPDVQDAGSVSRIVDRESGGSVSSSRADAIGESIGSEITRARSEAAQRVTDDGQVRGETGQFVGKLQNVEETVRNDGIYYRNTDTGTERRAARFNR